MSKTTAILVAGLVLLLAACNRSNQSQNQPPDAQQPVATIPEPAPTAPPTAQTPLANPPEQAQAPRDLPPRRDTTRTPPRQAPAVNPPVSQPPQMAERVDPNTPTTSTRPVEAVRRPPAPVAPPPPIIVPAGTKLVVRTTSIISSKNANPGDTFDATLNEDLRIDNQVVASKGSRVQGRVVTTDPGGRVKGKASLSVELTTLDLVNGATVRINTSDVAKEAEGEVKKDALKVGIASGIGAAIGAIAGGGKGAAIGAGAGAGAGTAAVMATRGAAATIPSESVLTFALNAPIEVKR